MKRDIGWCYTADVEFAPLSIGELAGAAGLSRRAIRFYVQQGLLPAPSGSGRGSHYDRSHLDRLRRIAGWQQAGHSLDQIRRLLAGGPAAAPVPRPAAVSRPTLSAELWTRLRLAPGVELQFDTSRHQPDVAGLLALRELAARVFARPTDNPDQGG